MISLSPEQSKIYNTLFSEYARETSGLKSTAKKFDQDSMSVFGYNVFYHFLKEIEDKSRNGNIAAYLENIILHTKFLTYLALRNEKDETFDQFYRSVAEFCLKLIKFFYPEAIKVIIYTKEFEAFLKDTIFFSLKLTPGELERIQNIFTTKASIISCNKCLESFEAFSLPVHPSKVIISRAVPPPPSKLIITAINTFVNTLCEQLNNIMVTNAIDDINLLDSTRTRLLRLAHKHSAYTANYTSFPSTRRHLPIIITLLFTIIASRTAGYMESNESYMLFMVLVIFTLGNVFSDTIRNVKGPLTPLEKTKIDLAKHERNLEDCFSLESQEYTGEQKQTHQKKDIVEKKEFQTCAMRIYTFAPLLSQSEQKKSKTPDYRPPKQQNVLSKTASFDKEFKKVPTEKLPSYYKRDSSGRLVLFNPAEIKELDKNNNPYMNPTRFSQSTYNIFPIKSSKQSKWREGKDVDFKLKLQGRDRARCYGIEETHMVNGKKEVVCHVLYYKAKTH